jgi:hypothetical protein
VTDLFYLKHENIYIVPILHYRMEMAVQTCIAFEEIKPDCVAVELAETMQLQLLHAASRLPDISVVVSHDQSNEPLYYLCEPCDPAFEALRSALENNIPAFCIDLDIDSYPDFREAVPDPYAIQRIGLKNYYESYEKITKGMYKTPIDLDREMHMARRLKELSFSHDKVLFVCGMSHAQSILQLLRRKQFPVQQHAERSIVELYTLTEKSCRDVLAEYAWISKHYEMTRSQYKEDIAAHSTLEETDLNLKLDRQQLIYSLYKQAAKNYVDESSNEFPGYHFRNLMKFSRNYALITNQLMPDLYQILSSAKGCVDHNFAYFVWEAATNYPYRRNIDNLPELNLTVEDVWKHSKVLRFHIKQQSRKSFSFHHRKDRSRLRFYPPGRFSICSYPKEDIVIERFGDFLKKKGRQIILDDGARTIPFSSSIEDGVDIRETIRHWYEKKLYVKVRGRPPGMVGSVVVVFDEDLIEGDNIREEKYPWKLTWIGEHQQESDMAFYATPMHAKVIGPGMSRCEYGGFMMSYPPRRMMDIWSDPDYQTCRSKAEVLLMGAIDYAVMPLIVYVAAKPPRSALRSFAQRYGKKIVYIPLGQLSPVTLNKIRNFHVLDSYDKRAIADEYID